MTWHADLQLEIAVEFRRLEGGFFWHYLEELGWIRILIKRNEFCASRRWFRQTTAGRRAHCANTKRRRKALRGVIGGYAKCSVCGKHYERPVLARKTRTTCSRSCATTKRNATTVRLVTIDGKTMHLTAWARHYGISQSLVQHRLKAGWDMRQAITTPIKSERKCATCGATFVTKRSDSQCCSDVCGARFREKRRTRTRERLAS